jgi:hypothetical protein
MLTQDKDQNCISYGALDNIAMRRMGEFRNLVVEPSNVVNGEASIWTVSFNAIAEV